MLSQNGVKSISSMLRSRVYYFIHQILPSLLPGVLFIVIDDSIVTPSSIVFLVVKARLVPPTGSSANPVSPVSKEAIDDARRDYDFLTSRKDAEDGPKEGRIQYVAHAPRWPGVSLVRRCPFLRTLANEVIYSIVNLDSGLFLRTPRVTEWLFRR